MIKIILKSVGGKKNTKDYSEREHDPEKILYTPTISISAELEA